MLIQHLRGNMISRWTDFLTTDGEKASRERDTEFERNKKLTSNELLAAWNEAWDRLFKTLAALEPSDLQKTITIRGEEHSVLEAIQRESVHYAMHVGQIIFLPSTLKRRTGSRFPFPGDSPRSFSVGSSLLGGWGGLLRSFEENAGAATNSDKESSPGKNSARSRSIPSTAASSVNALGEINLFREFGWSQKATVPYPLGTLGVPTTSLTSHQPFEPSVTFVP